MRQKINNTIGGKKAKASSAVKTVILSALLLVYMLSLIHISESFPLCGRSICEPAEGPDQ